MDILERFHQKFGRWYERLFNEAGEQALRPKDVLRKILDAMEQHRSEGFDGKVYVPNKYVLELAVSDPEEHDYLLSFLDEEELASVLKRYMAQNGYSIRGPLDFTIVDVSALDAAEKLTVKVKFEKARLEGLDASPSAAVSASSPPDIYQPPSADIESDDMLTVASVARFIDDEDLTVAAVPVAWAALVVTQQDGHRSLTTISRPEFTIGRSRQAGNDLTLSTDGQVSKRHARIERESDGKATIYDLGSTNGILVNGKLISGNATLEDGDEIVIGATRLVFQQDIAGAAMRGEPDRSPEAHDDPMPPKRARLVSRLGGAGRPLGSETLIGSGVTCDIVLQSDRASVRQAQIVSPDGVNYYLQDLAGKRTSLVNGRSLYGEERWRLQDGDMVDLGGDVFDFQASGSAGQ